MIFVDTNVLIRLMTDDIPHLRVQAESWVKSHAAGELFVPDIALTELFFVLQNNARYKLSRARVCELLRDTLQSSQFVVSPQAGQAFEIAEHHAKLDFTDCLLAVYAGRERLKLLSFDKDLLKILG